MLSTVLQMTMEQSTIDSINTDTRGILEELIA